MTWTAILNSSAGARPLDATAVEEAADRAGLAVDVHRTATLDGMQSLVAASLAAGQRRFLAIGGDGTVHHLVASLLDEHAAIGVRDGRITVGIVPTGSGSDLARTFAIPASPVEAFRRLVDPEMYPLDVGSITVDGAASWFVNVANVGVAAGSVALARRLPRSMGRGKYVMAFWAHLASASVTDIEVTVDHHHFSGRAINVVVANGQFFGGGMSIAPRASMRDGLFDVQVFACRRRDAFTLMPRVLRGSHLTHPAVRRYVGSSVAIRTTTPLPAEADGEMLGAGVVDIAMHRGAIDLAV
ncbi:MAG: hypothetical protein KDB69_08765 [Acidimicrobiia bacterium]|nr:hypothetical protein [Acidimicrobiia bacterium]